jgi:hypothetical protein
VQQLLELPPLPTATTMKVLAALGKTTKMMMSLNQAVGNAQVPFRLLKKYQYKIQQYYTGMNN